MKIRNQRGLLSSVCAIGYGFVIATGSAVELHEGKVPPKHTDPKLTGHVQMDAAALKSWEEEFAAGQSLYNSGRYDEAYKKWAQCLQLAEQQHADVQYDDARQLSILDKMALLYKTQQKPALAAKMYERAIALATKHYGRDSAQVAGIMLNLGRVYQYDNIKSYAKADELFDEALRINTKLYGADTIPSGDVEMALAQLKESENQYDKAAALWKHIIFIGDKLEGNIISCCRIGPRQGLARCYEKLHKYNEASAVYIDLIAMCKQGAHDMLPTVYSSYADCLQKMGRTDEAQKMLAEAHAPH